VAGSLWLDLPSARRHQVPDIAAQLRACHRDPCRLPLQLLGLTAPLTLTGNPAVT
jgi:hypothetical protein